MNDITFEKGQAGLGKALPGEDYISGMIFFKDTVPSGFTTTNRIKKVLSLPAAVALGIVNDKSDETKATGGNILITTAGAAGAINAIKMDGVTLGSYPVVLSDTEALVATGLRAAVNALTLTHGYSAAGSGANVLLTAPSGLGASINGGTHLTFTSTGTGAATKTQFSGGVDAFFDEAYYHVSEFFRTQPNGVLYVYFAAEPTTNIDFSVIDTLSNFADGKIRQTGIYCCSEKEFATTLCDAAQARTVILDSHHKLLSILIAADISSVSDLTTMPNLRALTDNKVSVIIGQDGNNIGADLFAKRGHSITSLGATLGTIALSKVNECIGYVEKFNVANVELEVPAIANGQLTKELDENLLTDLHNKGYIFLKKYVDPNGTAPGTYHNDSSTCISLDNDYSDIESNRTIDKAIRLVYSKLLPKLMSNVLIDSATGKLDISTVKYFETLGDNALNSMARAQELSGRKTVIDPNQDVNATGNLEVQIINVKTGVIRTMRVKIGYANKI